MTKLALYGGNPVNPDEIIPYTKHHITDEDKKAVMDALDHPWIAGNGPLVTEFEEAIADFTGYRYAIAVNSATSGLEAAYQIRFGLRNSVWIPALTFVATANALPFGVKCKLVDVDPHTLVLNHGDVGVSFAGYPVQGCAVADDAHYLYKHMNNFGNLISVISTHPAKHITTGEGGVILTSHEDLCWQMRKFVDHGRAKQGTSFYYGHNYRMPSINAALGLSQLKRAETNLRIRDGIAEYYIMGLKDTPGIVLPTTHPMHAWHLFVIRLRGIDRDWFRQALKAEGIGTQVHYPALNSYQHIHGDHYSVAEDVANNGVSIPMYPTLTFLQMHQTVEAIRKVADYAQER